MNFTSVAQDIVFGLFVGGIYGIAMGALFAGESMFHRVTGASKVMVP